MSDKTENDDTGVVVFWKDPGAADPGAFYRISKDVWDRLKIPEAESGLPSALVSRGAIVATMKDGTHPAGSWSTLINLAALLEAHKPDKEKAQAAQRNKVSK